MRSVLILQGISGSGKTTYAEAMVRKEADRLRYVVLVSADDHFARPGGGYVFDPSKLAEAHATCFRRVVEALAGRGQPREYVFPELVVVDNTNTTPAEVAPYWLGAQAFGYTPHIRKIVCDPLVAAARNTHDVPQASIVGQHARLADFLKLAPPWWTRDEIPGDSF